MPRRVNIDVPGVRHGDLPIPMATKVGNMVFSSGIHTMDPETGTIPDDPERQVELVFAHMRTIVENAGGSTDDIALVIFNIKDNAYRSLVNDEWLKMFPNDGDRPARNTHLVDLGFGMIIHVLMTAVLED